MTAFPRSFSRGCLLLFIALAAAFPAWSAPLPDNSVYRIPDLTLRDQRGNEFSFSSLRGEPHLLGMFYGSCKMVCPVEIETLKRIRHESGSHISVVLVTFDPKRDDLAMLRKVAAEHHVQAPSFRLARPETGDEGMLAGVLGIAYRSLPGGGFSHNVIVSLVDADGRIVARTDASAEPDPAFIRAIVDNQAGH